MANPLRMNDLRQGWREAADGVNLPISHPGWKCRSAASFFPHRAKDVPGANNSLRTRQ
jgi:hypothetical protein